MPRIREIHAELQGNDRHYGWKAGIRLVIIAVDLALVGMLAWVTTSSLSEYIDYSNWVYDYDLIPFDFIPVGLSVIYCAIALLLHLIRKRPIHPGIDVGADLIIWLAFAVLSGFTITLGLENISWIDDNGPFGYSSSDGYYTTASNGSSVYITPENAKDCPRFESCAVQQKFVREVQLRGRVELAAFALMILALILHFVLFVWACVDTQRRNNAHKSSNAKDIAQAMIAEMVANGQLAPPQQPLLFPGPSQRVSQAGSQQNLSREVSGDIAPVMPASPAAAHEFYAPNGQSGPYQTQSTQPHGLLPMPQGAQSEKQAPMQTYGSAPPLWANHANKGAPAGPPSPDRQPPSPPNPTGAQLQTPYQTPSPPAAASTKRASGPPDSPTPNGANPNSDSDIPPTKPLAVRSNGKTEVGSTSPALPARAPGHTAERSSRVSNISATTYGAYSRY